jgi:hypothetical protein
VKKRLMIGVLSILVTVFMAAPSISGHGPSKRAGKSNMGHLYLYEKMPDPDADRTDPWLIVEGGMWGKMLYNLSGPTFDFVFNGHSLPVGQCFELIYYPDPWPGDRLICLGSGTVNGGGNIHIQGSVETYGDLPMLYDDNANATTAVGYDYAGAKIFLVPCDDVDCEGQTMIGWSGDDANLYEDDLITFDDTND